MTVDEAKAVLSHVAPATLEYALTRYVATDAPVEFLGEFHRSMVEDLRQSVEKADAAKEAFLTLARLRAH